MSDSNLLDGIQYPNDLKQLNISQLKQLCSEIRAFLIDSVSHTGGHLASNLGVVELTVALHKVFDLPKDKIVWDVGHQSYSHKILTGRKDRFYTLRQENGLSGFTRPSESPYDAFIGGHASNSLSAAYGIAKANTLKGNDHFVVAVIGDGALTGGLAYEALNNAGRCKDKLIVILNHNEMSISKNVGAFARYLATIRSKSSYVKAKGRLERVLDHTPVVGKPVKSVLKSSKSVIKNMLYHSTIFEDFGFHYFGPVDGHNLTDLIHILNTVKTQDMPCIIQVDTIKGKGYQYAEENPGAFHGISTFDIQTGNPDISEEDSFSDIAGKAIKQMADTDPRICAITAAMKYGTGLQYFASAHRDRFFDVGISEEHAVTFAAGLASNGMIPFFCVYSTFLQRSYDEIIHDAAIEKTHIILSIDRAGIVGADGETHQGIFDVPFLSTIPGMTIYSPSTYRELQSSLRLAAYECSGVVSVRYPRGSFSDDFEWNTDHLPDYNLQQNESSVLLISYGREFLEVEKAAKALAQDGLIVSLLKLNKIHPISKELIQIIGEFPVIFSFEECIQNGCISQQILMNLNQNGYTGIFDITAIDDHFVPQAKIESALKSLGLDAASIYHKIVDWKKQSEKET